MKLEKGSIGGLKIHKGRNQAIKFCIIIKNVLRQKGSHLRLKAVQMHYNKICG